MPLPSSCARSALRAAAVAARSGDARSCGAAVLDVVRSSTALYARRAGVPLGPSVLRRAPVPIAYGVATLRRDAEALVAGAGVDAWGAVARARRLYLLAHSGQGTFGHELSIPRPGRATLFGGGRVQTATVLRVDPPDAVIRWPSGVVAPVSLEQVRVRSHDTPPSVRAMRRQWFDLFIFEHPGLRPMATLASSLRDIRATFVRTCPCCGWPTALVREPYLDSVESPSDTHPCVLCDWWAPPRLWSAAMTPIGGPTAAYTLVSARRNADVSGSIYRAEDGSVRAQVHRRASVAEAKRRVRQLFGAMYALRGDEVACFRYWRGAHAVLDAVADELVIAFRRPYRRATGSLPTFARRA